MPRFHLFEAGAFVTTNGLSPRFLARCVSTYLKLELLSPHQVEKDTSTTLRRFHLFEAGAFVTSWNGSGTGRFRQRFHLFEAGAFVTGCVS